MKQLEAKVRMAAIAALALVAAQVVAADAVKSLAGEWRVSGEGIEGVVRLPGTLADAKLGRHIGANMQIAAAFVYHRDQKFFHCDIHVLPPV